MRFALCLLILGLLGLPPVSAQTMPRPRTLAPMDHAPAELTVAGPDGSERVYTPALLEELPTYALRTTTPWREVPAEFEGILLTDLLAANGLDSAEAITVLAENEYAVTIPRAAWEALNILVATRVDGAPHSRRARGPIQFVVAMDTYQASPIAREDYLVWMAARIEPVE